jgi:anti-sigma factor RsiW
LSRPATIFIRCSGVSPRFVQKSFSAVESIRAAHPLYRAPQESLEAARRIVGSHQRRSYISRIAIAAGVILAVWLGLSMRPPPDSFARFAAESHQRFEHGSLPLDIHSTEPRDVSAWLTQRLPFHLTLPNYPELPGEAKRYQLMGARLLQMGSDDVAYLAYRMEGRPISLLIASSARIVPAGGDVYRSGGLTFHMSSLKGFKMITWVDKGLSYALVSDLEAMGAESCVICHGGAGERRKFEELKRKL